MSTLAWVAVLGLAASVPALVIDRPSGPVPVEAIAWLGVSGLAYVIGLLLLYVAMSRGPVGIAAPIASTEGAVAAVIAIGAGEDASLALLVALAIIVAGLLITTLSRDRSAAGASTPGFIGLSAGAALALGVGLFAAAQVGDAAPISWLMAAGRIVGVLLLAIPLAIGRRLRFERSVLGWLVAAGVLEVVGFVGFGIGAPAGVAVTAVLASQFAVVATVGAALLGERLEPRRWLGVGIVAIGVAAVALLQA
jgi:drug/metabolite transporter (DMT)-like permease